MNFLDFETQSAADLRRVGARKYVRHDTTRILCAVFVLDRDIIFWVPPGRAPHGVVVPETPGYTTQVWDQEVVPPFVEEAIRRDPRVVAHNAEHFDRLVWERFIGHLSPVWVDTVHLCRAAGLPGGLDAASKALGGAGKQDDGKRLITLLCKTEKRATGHVQYAIGTKELWGRFLAYNLRDVLAMIEVYEKTRPYMKEDALISVHTEINRRGIPVDRKWVENLSLLWERYRAEAGQEIDTLTGGCITVDKLGSPAQFKKWLAGMGCPVPSLRRQEVEHMVADPEGFFGDTGDPAAARAVAAIRIRADAVRATPAKVTRICEGVEEDGRMRGVFVYHGAHTGRWSGRELQPHNFPRGSGSVDVAALIGLFDTRPLTLEDIREHSHGASVGDALATLMRPSIRASEGHTLVVADYAGVEARGVAWLAGDEAALAAFRDPDRDIYLDMASAVFGRTCTKEDKDERQIGKIIVLGCGYGMGHAKFGAFCSLSGADLEKAGTTAEACVQAYRTKYAAIKSLWRSYDSAVHAAIHGRDGETGRCSFFMDGAYLCIRLPSGRVLRYRNARIEDRLPRWGTGLAKVPTMVYDSPQGFEKTLYGGLLTENITQAVCRDLLADAIMCTPDVIMHVHDEIVLEAPEEEAEERLQKLVVTMATGPDWAEGFPIRVEGYTGKRYTKSPLPGAIKRAACSQS